MTNPFRALAGRLHDVRRNRWRVSDRALSVTREGAIVLGATFLIGAAAINTGNNLLYLLVAMLLGTITVSGVLSEMVLRGLAIERRLPPSPHAGTLAAVRYRIANHKKRFPSFALVAEDSFPAEYKAIVLYLRAGDEAVVESAVRCPHRGIMAFQSLEIVTRFPFGLFQKRKLVSLPGALIVYPSLSSSARGDPAGGGQGEQVPTHARGTGGELFELRDYVPGDSLRSVHWKTTARRGVLTAEEHEDEDRPRITLVLDTSALPPPTFDPPDARARFSLERAVSQLAGTVKEWDAKGYLTRLYTDCGEVPYGRGEAHVHRMWEHLALFEMPPAPAQHAPFLPGEARLVIRAAPVRPAAHAVAAHAEAR